MSGHYRVQKWLALLTLCAGPLAAGAQQPPWQVQMDDARRNATEGHEQSIILTFPAPEAERSGVYVFYNNPRPFCYTYMIPGEWIAKPRERAYYSKDGRKFAGVQFWLAPTLESEGGATLVERAGSRITRLYRREYGQALVDVEFAPFESTRPGVWRWRAAPIAEWRTPRGAARVDFPAKLVVDLSPDAIAQITVNGPSAEDQLALAQRILESLRTSKDPDCYLPVLESMYKSMHVNR